MYPLRLVLIAVLLFLSTGLAAWAEPQERADRPRGYLGVQIGPAEEGRTGIVVGEVTPGSPAAKAGLKNGDHIVKLGNQEVRDVEQFLQSVAMKKPGEKVTLGILRNDKEQNLTVTLGKRPSREAPAFPDLPRFGRQVFLGVQMQNLTPELKKRLKVGTDTGAQVSEIMPNSPAAQAGLRPDDVITGIDNQPVTSPEDLQEAIRKAVPGKKVALQVVRGEEKLTIKATLRESPFGFFPMPGVERFPKIDVEPMLDPDRRIRELKRRIEELEKRIRKLEKK